MALKRSRPCEHGYVIVKTIGVILISLMTSVLAVDMGFYYAAQNRLQTAADAGALAGAGKLFKGDASSVAERQTEATDDAVDIAQLNAPFTDVYDGDVDLVFVDISGALIDPDAEPINPDEEYAFSGGFNGVQVAVWADPAHDGVLSTLMGRLVNVDEMETVAVATAVMDDQVEEFSGLRPIYACRQQWDLADEDGDLTNDVVRVYGDRFELNGDTTTCDLPGPGNWGFADLRDCAPGAPGVSTLRDWWEDGYPNPVYAGQCYSTQTGNSIASVNTILDGLIANETVIVLPIADSFSGTGSTAQVDVSGFTGFVITDYQDTGAQANRYIEGYFVRTTCTSTCRTNSNVDGGGVAKLRLVRPSS